MPAKPGFLFIFQVLSVVFLLLLGKQDQVDCGLRRCVYCSADFDFGPAGTFSRAVFDHRKEARSLFGLVVRIDDGFFH
jgi:hypothetical protein